MSTSLPIDAIDAAFTAMARRDVVAVDVDGEIILYDDSRGVLHRLNPTASALWQCLDGSGTLGEIAADMADVFQVDGDRVFSTVFSWPPAPSRQAYWPPRRRVGSSLTMNGEPIERPIAGDGRPEITFLSLSLRRAWTAASRSARPAS